MNGKTTIDPINPHAAEMDRKTYGCRMFNISFHGHRFLRIGLLVLWFDFYRNAFKKPLYARMFNGAVLFHPFGSVQWKMPAIRRAAFVAIMAAAALSQGCATVATHYQIKGGYEREARQNVMRGKPALCAVDGEQKRVDDISTIEMIRANLLDYAKAVLLDVASGFVVWYIAEQRKQYGEKAGDTFNTYNTYEAPATEAAPQ